MQGPHSKAGMPVVYSGAMKIAANPGHYNTNEEVEEPSAKGKEQVT